MRTMLSSLLAAVLSLGAPPQAPPLAAERHLANIRQLTHGGENAEAYFSSTGRQLVFQSTRPPFDCDQIFTMDADGGSLRQVSSGKGRTTCAYFLPGDRRVLYASTHDAGDACPPKPDMSQGYVWALHDGYDIYTARVDGHDVRRLTRSPGYDAEATVAPDGRRVVFTSVRDGDLELYSMKLDGSDVRRLTHERGYDGGAFYSPDARRIVYRASHPADPAALERYGRLLLRGLVEPRSLEIMVMNADGSGKRQITHNGKANFAPFFHPDGRRVIFASNLDDPRGRDFDLYLIGVDGTGLERVTFNDTFDGFPMFSPDGRRLVFASNRNASRPGETNVFIADWQE